MKVKIIAVSSLKEDYWKSAANEYIKRLGGYCEISVDEVPPVRLTDKPSEKEIETALLKEGEAISKLIPPKSLTVALCIEGKRFSSESFASLLENEKNMGFGSAAFIIGSSYGISEEVKKKCRIKMSMSEMTFPHKFARIMLLEQIYRAFKINEGSDYHK